jgi:glyoxylase-like metal-dependent hydrolase (beta-lactamase superfamily II)
MAPIVHTYRSGESGLFVNSYLVQGAEGVVAIDTPLLLSDGRAFRARFEALGKPLLGVLVTHPHPDHYNTITELLSGVAFVGDLAFNGTHAYLADGHTKAWLDAIDRAEEALAGVHTLYVGHGGPAVPAVLADQRRYLLMAREAIGRVASGRAQLSEDEANRVAHLMERYLPGAPLSWLVGAGASAVAAELAQDTAPA